MNNSLLEQLRLLSAAQHALGDELGGIVKELMGEPAPWCFPIGSTQYPPPDWYCASWHDLTGKRNNGYGHTGIDLNVCKPPYGDIDRGQPGFAVADGVIFRVGYSQSYLGSVILLVGHERSPLYARYWHLADDATFRSWTEGQVVKAGTELGHIGNYTLGAGGDHLHLDAALDPFEPHWWFTNHPVVRWIDPVPILKAHLDPAQVEAMLEKR